MPLLVSGLFAHSLVGARDDHALSEELPDRQTCVYEPWLRLDSPANMESVGEWTRAQLAWSLMITSDDPGITELARRALDYPLVCTGHIDALHELGADITAARLTGFRVAAAVVAGVRGKSSGSDEKRKKQKRALTSFQRTYGVEVMRLRRSGKALSRDLLDTEILHDDVQRHGNDWKWTLDVPGADEHVRACGQSANVATFRVDDAVVMRELPSVLQRCTMHSAVVRPHEVEITFSPDPRVWPGSNE